MNDAENDQTNVVKSGTHMAQQLPDQFKGNYTRGKDELHFQDEKMQELAKIVVLTNLIFFALLPNVVSEPGAIRA